LSQKDRLPSTRFMKFAIESQRQLITRPRSSGGIAPLSSSWMWMPMLGIPSSAAQYISHRAPSARQAYRELSKNATVEVLDIPGTDEDAYLAAGHRVVDNSDIMLAVWDGKPAKGKGGTADVVDYAIKRGIPLIHIDPLLRIVHRP
jgi:hypothetical protein